GGVRRTGQPRRRPRPGRRAVRIHILPMLVAREVATARPGVGKLVGYPGTAVNWVRAEGARRGRRPGSAARPTGRARGAATLGAVPGAGCNLHAEVEVSMARWGFGMAVQLRRHRFTTDDYHRLGEAGILGE